MTNQTPQDPVAGQKLPQQPPNQPPTTAQDSGDSLAALEDLIKQSQQRAADQPTTNASASNSQTEPAIEETDPSEAKSDEAVQIAALKEQKEQEALERLKQNKLEMQAMVEESPQTTERAKSKQEQKEAGQRELDNAQTKIRQLSHTTVKKLKD
jgi:hypothetical protein